MERIPNKIKPRVNEIVITANVIAVENKEGKIINKDEQQLFFDEFQEVLAVGSVVRDINVGDIICVNPKRFAKYEKQKTRLKAVTEGYEEVLVGYDFPLVETCRYGNVMLITDSDVRYIVDGFCEEENCNTNSPYIASPEDLKEDFPNETV